MIYSYSNFPYCEFKILYSCFFVVEKILSSKDMNKTSLLCALEKFKEPVEQ